MTWFTSSPPAAAPTEEIAIAIPPQPTTTTTTKPKPCCVCKDEKSTRDECMLFSQSDDPQEDCKSTVDKYKSCMASYGFKI